MDLDRLITETVRRQLLVENAKNNSWNAARKMVIDRFRYTKEEAENMLDEICIFVGLSYEMVKFIKGCTRMFLNGELKDPQVINDFKDALNKIKTDGHIKEFDSNLRRVDQPENAVNSAKDIISIFKPEIDRERAEQRQKLSGVEFVPNTDYNIVKINSFEEACKYSRYTSWCVTKDKFHYNSYITNGINQFYFCLQNGFENIENDGNFDDKKDIYALSMLAILVNPEGELIHCTNRKNNDQSTLNPFEISKLLGCNFYETFKPNTTWQDMLEDVKSRLSNGVPVEDVFEEVRRDGDLVDVCLSGRWNILGEGNTFLCDHWYDDVWYFREGFAVVEDNNKGWNFIDSEGNEICDRWYDVVHCFREGLAKVKDEAKGWNFINREGEEVCDRWYVSIGDFYEGFARVKDKNKGWNFINRDGKEICDRWYDYAGVFYEGFARVKDENECYNFINREGKEICDRWYDGVYDFSEGFAAVRDKNKGWNFINREGKEIGDRWYDSVGGFYEGFAMIFVKDKGYNFIGKNFKEISDQWYEDAESFNPAGYSQVYTSNKGWFFIDVNGNEVDYETVCEKSKDQVGVTRRRRRTNPRKPFQEESIEIVESLINRLVKSVIVETRKRGE